MDEEVKVPKGYNTQEAINYLERILNEVKQRVVKLEQKRRAIPSVTACRCDADYTGLPCRCGK